MAKKSALDFEEDRSVGVTEELLGRLATIAVAQLAAEDEVSTLSEKLDEANAVLRIIRTEVLPSLMFEAGVDSFTLKNGAKIDIKKTVKASISEDRKEKAFAWLRKNGHGSLIKMEVVAKFGRGEESAAKILDKELEKKGIVHDRKESVHGQTLSAFVREQLADGTVLPMELLGVFQYDESIITQPKK